MEPGRALSQDESRPEQPSRATSDNTKVGVREQGITVLYERTTAIVESVIELLGMRQG
jgi:hypothetical protein